MSVKRSPEKCLTLFLACTVLLLASCAGPKKQRPPSMEGLAADEGYVLFRLLSSEMAEDPEAIWGQDFRLNYRPFAAGPLDTLTSSLKMRGRHVSIKAGTGPGYHLLELDGGQHEFHSVVASVQEAPLGIVFDVANGRVTYIGDLQVDLNMHRIPMGTVKPRRVGLSVGWSPDEARAALERMFPEGASTLRLKEATIDR